MRRMHRELGLGKGKKRARPLAVKGPNTIEIPKLLYFIRLITTDLETTNHTVYPLLRGQKGNYRGKGKEWC